MLNQVKTVIIVKAMQRRHYLVDLMRIQELTILCAEQRANYDPACPTAFDDISFISQFDIDLVSLQMIVKVWEDEINYSYH